MYATAEYTLSLLSLKKKSTTYILLVVCSRIASLLHTTYTHYALLRYVRTEVLHSVLLVHGGYLPTG